MGIMGYGFKSYVDAVLILTGIKGQKAMANKADEVRKLLTEGASRPRIVLAIAKRCKAEGGNWIAATVAQTAAVLDCGVLNARALVSEYTGQKTTI